MPITHAEVAPEHTTPHAPQLLASLDTSTQERPIEGRQSTRDAGQAVDVQTPPTQFPLQQLELAMQALPLGAQLLASGSSWKSEDTTARPLRCRTTVIWVTTPAVSVAAVGS